MFFLVNQKRKKESEEKKSFHFPLYYYCTFTDEYIIKYFSEEEKALNNAESFMIHGEFKKSEAALYNLLQTGKDSIVRYGTIYCLCITNIYLHNYSSACYYYRMINLLYADQEEFKNELFFLLCDLETYFTGNRVYFEELSIDPSYPYPIHMQGYILLQSAYSDMLKLIFKEIPVNTIPYDLICLHPSSSQYQLYSMMLHVYLSIIHYYLESKEKTNYHILEAVRICEEYHYEHHISFLLYYAPDKFLDILKRNNPVYLDQLIHHSKKFGEAFHGLLNYLEKNTVIQLLNASDYQFIRYAQKGLANKEISSMLNLSETTISKKYTVLYEKTGVHNKKELIQLTKDIFQQY